MKSAIILAVLCTIYVTVSAEVTCPPIDPETPVYLPHETECGKFYECSGGKKFLLSCAPGSYWDQKLNACAYDVDCHGLQTSTAPPPTTTSPKPF